MKIINSRKGLTLLEIVLATVIMLLGIIPIMRFAPSMIHQKADVEEATEVAFLGTRLMEDTKVRVLDDFRESRDAGTIASPIAFTDADYADYRYVIRDDEGDFIKTIEVEVWHVDNPNNRFLLATQIAGRGIPNPEVTERVWNRSLEDYQDATPYYQWINSAVNDTNIQYVSGRTQDIRARADNITGFSSGPYVETITIDDNYDYNLSGGWEADFRQRRTNGYSTIDGSLTIRSGRVTIRNFIIR